MHESLNDKIVLVTGAAGAIGAATARAFRQLGAELFLIDRDEAGVRTLAGDIGAGWLAADVTAAGAGDVIVDACVMGDHNSLALQQVCV